CSGTRGGAAAETVGKGTPVKLQLERPGEAGGGGGAGGAGARARGGRAQGGVGAFQLPMSGPNAASTPVAAASPPWFVAATKIRSRAGEIHAVAKNMVFEPLCVRTVPPHGLEVTSQPNA